MRIANLLLAAFVFMAMVAPALAAKPGGACPACSQSGAAACVTCAEQAKEQPAAKSTVKRSGNWLIEETKNFSICRPVSYQMKPGMAEAFESLREELRATWSGASTEEDWQPRCHVVIHAGLAGYMKEVGPGGRQTSGSSALDFDDNRVTMRRIDIRGDRSDWFTEAFAHELTHVVLADRFVRVAIPHWADEGMAILADPLTKRRLHIKDLHSAVAAGSEFRLAELFVLENYPHPSRMGTFYGQSASLVEFLTQLGTKEQLVSFVDQATSSGYDTALREVYSIASVGALEQQWRRHLRDGKLPAEAISRRPSKPGVSTTETAQPSVLAADESRAATAANVE